MIEPNTTQGNTLNRGPMTCRFFFSRPPLLLVFTNTLPLGCVRSAGMIVVLCCAQGSDIDLRTVRFNCRAVGTVQPPLRLNPRRIPQPVLPTAQPPSPERCAHFHSGGSWGDNRCEEECDDRLICGCDCIRALPARKWRRPQY